MSDIVTAEPIDWNDPKQLNAYEIGYREGEGSNGADWVFALGDLLPDEVDPWDPRAVAEWIRRGLTS